MTLHSVNGVNKPKGPLEGIRILDFSTLLPGPYATMILADMGAHVIRVVAPERPDQVESLPPFVEVKGKKTSVAHLYLNRNKRSIALDLKVPESVSAVKKLLVQSDVLIEQFRPGVMAKFGLAYEDLKTTYPGLVYCSLTGFGQTGSHAKRAGHDINYLALSGLASYSGRKETGPVLSGAQVADLAGGAQQAVMAILAALLARTTSGQGQHLDISMTDGAFALNALFGACALGTDTPPATGGTLLNGGSHYDYYQTGDGRYLAVGALEPKFLSGLCEALNHPEWKTLGDHSPAMFKALLTEAFKQHPLSYWQALFAPLDICVEPVLDFCEAASLTLVSERQMLWPYQTCDGKEIKQIAPPLKFDGCEPPRHTAVPSGADSQAILAALGFSDSQIQIMSQPSRRTSLE
ncbi:CaiB/BaiF CoA-transferase family protein [Aliiglaciecola sp. CAU 1673]|uniref:CaiB/BaiF CoA transferase family protein n=1 Tax=Aliiglaciecola sp. CAU 1673 TaxID=3032595 RepID=UPI0023DCB81E|nr:CaiB/BaiF CoA-transferase family protein [Aliiglaciecola sp. CAU 1673]MDF2178148.1 CaiB/BaiF CoA-transferase family protein [Aliiglaciecola sp. CAU 1673]